MQHNITKCLSVSQPFAHLITSRQKSIELRSWNTNFRGEFFIHAPLKVRTSDTKRLKNKKGIQLPSPLHTGAIIGKAELVDIKKYQSIKEIVKDSKMHLASTKMQQYHLQKKGRCYGFILKNAKMFGIPIPCKGKLGFFGVKSSDLPAYKKITKSDITTEIIEEEYRYQWINHH